MLAIKFYPVAFLRVCLYSLTYVLKKCRREHITDNDVLYMDFVWKIASIHFLDSLCI